MKRERSNKQGDDKREPPATTREGTHFESLSLSSLHSREDKRSGIQRKRTSHAKLPTLTWNFRIRSVPVLQTKEKLVYVANASRRVWFVGHNFHRKSWSCPTPLVTTPAERSFRSSWVSSEVAGVVIGSGDFGGNFVIFTRVG